MKIKDFNQNYSNKKQSITFKAGMTSKIISSIVNTDVADISNKLAKKGVDSEFRGNKIVAWCSGKVVEIFEQINDKFAKNLPMPKGIYVEDFANLKSNNLYSAGFCNMFPTYLYKNSAKVIDGKTLFFNNYSSINSTIPSQIKWQYDWEYINTNADLNYARKQFATPHFLNVFLHEFSHLAHEENMLKKFGGKKLLDILNQTLSKKEICKFAEKYNNTVSEICDYATASPLETIACDMPKKIVSALDESLNITKNPFKNTPYEKSPLIQRLNNNYPNTPLDNILRNFWNGNFN